MHTRQEGLVEPWRSELRRGLERLRDGEFAAAEAHFARAHRFAPERAEVCFALGRERLRRGDLREAEALLRQAWRLDHSLLSSAAYLARCLGLELGDPRAADLILAEAYAFHGRAAPLLVVEAELRLEESRLDEARAAAEEVIANAGASAGAREAGRAVLARVFNQAGIRLADGGDPEAALFAFRRAADLDPDWSAPRSNLGAAFEAIGRLERAEAAYHQAVDIDPDSAAARFNLARLLRQRGDVGGALDVVESVAAGESTELLALYAELCVEVDQPERATELLDAAVARAPQRPEAWVDLAAGWQALGERLRAEDCLRIALDLDPDCAAAKLRLADLLVRDGRYIEAGQLATEAQAADPDLAEALLGGGPRLTPGRER